jgi:hypothetical protein
MTNPRRGTDLAASGSAVDIVSIPWHFLASRYDKLEQLFLPLLSSAQQASDLMGVRVGGEQSALQAASHLAGEFLRDNTFVPVRVMTSNSSNAYLIDFAKNVFNVETSIESRTVRNASLFRVRVDGSIRGDKFIVADPVTNARYFSFTKFEAEKPDFFTREFPFIACEARRDPTLFSGDYSALIHGIVDLVLGIPIDGTTIAVRVYKQAEISSAEIRNPTTHEVVMSLPLASLGNMNKVVETITQYLTTNAQARLAMGIDSATPRQSTKATPPSPQKG